MTLVLENKNGRIAGVIQDPTGKEIYKVTDADLKENEINLYYGIQGTEVSLNLRKKDNDHATGSMMGMFDVEGERIKQK